MYIYIYSRWLKKVKKAICQIIKRVVRVEYIYIYIGGLEKYGGKPFVNQPERVVRLEKWYIYIYRYRDTLEN